MNSDDILQQQLAAWEVTPAIPSRFQANVWARIATQGARRSWGERFQDWFANEVCKPHLAAAMVACGLLLGIGTAFLQARGSNDLADRQLETRYMETINPLAHASHSL